MTDTAKYASTFDLVDSNNDGRISAPELQQMMQAMGEDVSEEQAAEMIRKIDTDDDGEVSLEELTAFLSRGSA